MNGKCINQSLSSEMSPIRILWDFEIQTDYLVPARKPDLVSIN